ncbi:MAG: aminotransferase class V-fold PLP-dependent enzyme [Anaerolineae bacterium]|nr:aminotransferase class V-fold PLP-dependent enzyme [Anaerolineae bacterium]
MDWEKLRADFPAANRHVYLNTAGIGITPAPVTAEIQRLFGEWSAQGATTPSFRQEAGALAAAARERAARLFHASPRELAFTGRVAESLHIVIDGLRWCEGDEIVTSDEEVLYAPLYRVAQEHGVVVRQMRLEHDRAALLERLDALLTARTRLVWLSDTTNKTGIHLPARAICDLAHAHGALVMFDGAQTAGQFPVDLQASDCDFYAITGYKWLLGPYGCGLCYIREALLPELRAYRLGHARLDHAHSAYEQEDSALAFEFGVRNVILRIGYGKALEYVEALGLEAIHARMMALRDHLWRGLDALEGVRIASPADPDLNSAITCVLLPGIDPAEAVAAAWEANIVIVPTEIPTGRPDLRGVRISPAFYNTEEDLDRLLQLLQDLLVSARR